MGNGLIDGDENQKQSKNERIKLGSNYLRGKVEEQLVDGKDKFGKPSTELMKFHGIYQETNREKDFDPDAGHNPHVFMIRSRIPGGRVTADQWLAYDELADEYGQGSIRLTTRQTIQFHWIQKGNLKSVMQGIDKCLLTATGGCGDIVRNVTQAPNPLGMESLGLLDPIVQMISDHYKAKSNAYNEIWLDGKKVNPEEESEPLFGKQYLPRKFKICLTAEGNNSVDLFMHDLGIAATYNEANGIDGFFIFVGGGHGRSHNAPETFPTSAQLLGWIPLGNLLNVCDAVVSTQRDYGDRVNRKHARLKYLVHDKGIDWFREKVEKRSECKFEPREPAKWEVPNYLGFQQRENGKWSLGVHILSGRVLDRPGYYIKTALREIFQKYKLSCHLTSDQDLILIDIEEKHKDEIRKIFHYHHVDFESSSPLYDRALSCVAMPTCALAITESERWLPSILHEIQKILCRHDLVHKAPLFRITGCPNGCCRPYNAELALIGQAPSPHAMPAPGKYQIWLGGAKDGTRLAFHLADMVAAEDLPEIFDKFFLLWKEEGEDNEHFGDFVLRIPRKKLLDCIPESTDE